VELTADADLLPLFTQAMHESYAKTKGKGVASKVAALKSAEDKEALIREIHSDRVKAQEVRERATGLEASIFCLLHVPASGCQWLLTAAACLCCSVLRLVVILPWHPCCTLCPCAHHVQEAERKMARAARTLDHLERARREEEAPYLAQMAAARLVGGVVLSPTEYKNSWRWHQASAGHQ
jgi:hypothetical protein